MKNTSKILNVGLIAVLTILSAGCGAFVDEEPSRDTGDRFYTSWRSEKGFEVRMEGLKVHWPGEISEFRIDLSNTSGETWEGRFCLFLVDTGDVIEVLAREDFQLPPSGILEKTVSMELPEGFPEDPYGLVLLIPDHGSQVNLIWVGEEKPVSVGPWPGFDRCPLE